MPELLLIIFMKVIGVVVGKFYDTILIKMMFDFTKFFIKTSFIFEIPAEYWMRLQAQYELDHARIQQKTIDRLAHAAKWDKRPLNESNSNAQ
jgi:hypothetical protein